jgi:hypothetical protein
MRVLMVGGAGPPHDVEVAVKKAAWHPEPAGS